jgi:protein-S-isoprenylcysteine O-methyltransferase Ste14
MLYAAALVASWILQMVAPLLATRVPLWVRAAGCGIIVFGLIFDFGAMLALHRARTTILPNRAASSLVTAWPFSVSRNPIYLGNTLALGGLTLLLAWPWLFVMTVITVMLVRKLAIDREERHLAQVFGDTWLDYRSKTPRWIWPL